MRRASQRESTIDALVAEIDQAIADLRVARKLVARLERDMRGRSGGARPSPRAVTSADRVPSTRFSGLSVTQAAAVLEIGEEQVRRLLRAGELRGTPYGGRVGWRLNASYVERLAAKRRADREEQQAARQSGTATQGPSPRAPRSRRAPKA